MSTVARFVDANRPERGKAGGIASAWLEAALKVLDGGVGGSRATDNTGGCECSCHFFLPRVD